MQFTRMRKSVFYLLISFWIFFQPNGGFCISIESKSSDNFVLEQEYKIWKANGTKLSNILLFKLFEHYKKERSWESGFKTLFRFDQALLSNFEKKEILVQKALMDLLLNFPEKAIEVCLSIENDSLSINQRKLMTSVLLVSLIKTRDYRLSQTKFENYISTTKDENSHTFELKENYRQQVIAMNNLPLKSVKKARRLSMFLPPAGLFYAGSPKRGFISLGLQLASVGYLTANVLFQNYATAATFNLHWVRLFYIGAVNQSNELVKNYNEKILVKEEAKLKDLIFDLLQTTDKQ